VSYRHIPSPRVVIDLRDLDASLFGKCNHAGSSSASRERDYQIRFALIEHTLVSDGASLATELIPFRHVDFNHDFAFFGPFHRKRICPARTPRNYHRAAAVSMQVIKRRMEHRPIFKIPAATYENTDHEDIWNEHTEASILGGGWYRNYSVTRLTFTVTV
jgi:hypothetical protein